MDKTVCCWISAGTFPVACITSCGSTCLDGESGRHAHITGLTVILICAVFWEITINKLKCLQTPNLNSSRKEKKKI